MQHAIASPHLAVEISDSTLDMDLGRKAQLYASHGVPEYWVVDVEAGVLHRMSTPDGDAYCRTKTFGFGTPVSAATIDGLAIALPPT